MCPERRVLLVLEEKKGEWMRVGADLNEQDRKCFCWSCVMGPVSATTYSPLVVIRIFRDVVAGAGAVRDHKDSVGLFPSNRVNCAGTLVPDLLNSP